MTQWVVYLWFVFCWSSNRLSNYLHRYLYMCYRRFDCFYRKFPFDRNLFGYALYRTYFGYLSSTGKYSHPIQLLYIFFAVGCRNRKLFGFGWSYWWFWFTKERENGKRKDFGSTLCKEKGIFKWVVCHCNILSSFVVVMPFRWQIMQSTRLLDRLMKRLVAKIFKHFVHEWKSSKTIMF